MLTPKQKAVLDFITEFQRMQGYAPSQHEIAEYFKFKSLGTVQNYLVRLQRQGLLRKSWNGKRSIEISEEWKTDTAARLSLISSQLNNCSQTELQTNTVPLPLIRKTPKIYELPVLGRVAAGRPIEYIENDQMLEVPSSLFEDQNFVLKVMGDSMIEDGILNGDYVVVRKQEDAEQGQTVVAMIGNEATIKRYYRKSKQIELHPANPAYEPLLINSLTDARGFRIEGVLVGVIRKLA